MSKKNEKKEDLDLNENVDITTYVDDIDNNENDSVDNFNEIGTVIGCEKLRVRPTSNTDQEEIALIDEGSTVKISLEDSTEDFYKVKTDDGIEGYCMRSFINMFNVGE
jgi:SH3 domain protein